MKSAAAAVLVLASLAQAHYTFPYYITPSGNVTGEWEYVRETANHYSNAPVTDVNSTAIACYQLTTGSEGAATASVAAGDLVGLQLDTDISHPGPLAWYMAKAPAGDTAATMNGSASDVEWFKIAQDTPTATSAGLVWPAEGLSQVNVTLPTCLADGDYLLRVEQIALHAAEEVGGAQFYLSCTQLTVTGGGDFAPTSDETCNFPGCYTGYEPGLVIDLYYPIPTTYTNPGPAPITCAAGSGSTSTAASAATTSAASVVSSSAAASAATQTTLATSAAAAVASSSQTEVAVAAASSSVVSSAAAAAQTSAAATSKCSKRKRRSQKL